MLRFGLISAILVVAIYMGATKPPHIMNTIEGIFLFFRSQALKYSRPKYFFNDRVDYQPIAFQQVLSEITTTLEKHPREWKLITHYPSESDRTTTITLLTDFDSAKSSLIYHHGAGDTKPMKDYSLVFGQAYTRQYNVFVVKAQHHASHRDYRLHSVDTFLHHQLTFAGSVLAYEEIIAYHRQNSGQKVIATGISMGGIVSSLHAFHYGSADYYFPLVAYPNVGEIFISPAYQDAIAAWEQKRKVIGYPESFRITKVDASLKSKVFPILGEKDTIVEFEKAYKFWNQAGFEVRVFPYGHLTPAFARKQIRQYIQEKTH